MTSLSRPDVPTTLMSGLAWVMLSIIERRMHNVAFLPIFVLGSALILSGVIRVALFDEW